MTLFTSIFILVNQLLLSSLDNTTMFPVSVLTSKYANFLYKQVNKWLLMIELAWNQAGFKVFLDSIACHCEYCILACWRLNECKVIQVIKVKNKKIPHYLTVPKSNQKSVKYPEMNDWLLFNANSAIFQLFHDENKLHWMGWCPRCTKPTRLVGF